jgi:septum site-determining protein MinC
VRDAGEAAGAAALAAGLPLVRMDGARLLQRGAEAGAAPAGSAQAGAARTLTVTQPVRSGQQVYARGGDLVLLGPVSAGAEVVADGSIHAYGRLRGRAMAGVQGDRAARIYCRHLEAELVAVAGIYRLSEQIGDAERAAPMQVRLDGESLLIEPL